MRDSAISRADCVSRTQSQRITRETPSVSIVFHPVSSHRGQGTRNRNPELQNAKRKLRIQF
jgi:hypothetical protein